MDTFFNIFCYVYLGSFVNEKYTIGNGIGSWGLNKTINWKLGHNKFCLVDWNWSLQTLISKTCFYCLDKNGECRLIDQVAMTIFGVKQALFPLIHMGRPWLLLVFPIPNQFGSLWVNFNSPLLWDVFLSQRIFQFL